MMGHYVDVKQINKRELIMAFIQKKKNQMIGAKLDYFIIVLRSGMVISLVSRKFYVVSKKTYYPRFLNF